MIRSRSDRAGTLPPFSYRLRKPMGIRAGLSDGRDQGGPFLSFYESFRHGTHPIGYASLVPCLIALRLPHIPRSKGIKKGEAGIRMGPIWDIPLVLMVFSISVFILLPKVTIIRASIAIMALIFAWSHGFFVGIAIEQDKEGET